MESNNGMGDFFDQQYDKGFIKGFINGFSETVAKKFEKLIAEKLNQKVEETLNDKGKQDIEEFMDEVSDSFYYFYDVIPKEEIDKILNSDKTE